MPKPKQIPSAPQKKVAMKTKKCRVCKKPFLPSRSMQICCSLECAYIYSQGLRAKKERAEYREKKASLKSRQEWLKDAQHVVNKYVRLRDRNLGCVSCDKTSTWNGQWHASHFRSVGASSAVRFNLWNIHKSCSVCNKWKSGNLSEYEPRLRKKIGDEKVDWLREQNKRSEYSIDYLKRLIRVFKMKIKKLENKQNPDRAI